MSKKFKLIQMFQGLNSLNKISMKNSWDIEMKMILLSKEKQQQSQQDL